jgi:hypothetical protein
VKAKPIRPPRSPKPVVYSMDDPKFYNPNTEVCICLSFVPIRLIYFVFYQLQRKRRKVFRKPAVGGVAGVDSIPTSNGGMTSTFSVQLDVMGPNDPSVQALPSTNLRTRLPLNDDFSASDTDRPTHDYQRSTQPVCSYSTTATT